MKTLRMPRNSKGFSTVEMLVSAVIGAFVLLSVVTVMANSKKNYSQNDATVRLQENARFAMTAIAYDLRMSGYAGCVGTDLNTVDPVFGVEGDPDNQISDSFTVQYSDPRFGIFELASLQPGSTSEIAVVNENSASAAQAQDTLSVGDTIVISDCGSTQTHDVAAVNGNVITLDGTTFDAKNSNVFRIMRLMSYEYEVDIDAQSNTPTLYRSENGGSREPLVEGIEYLRVLFGVDTTGDKAIDSYVSPTTLSGGTQVTNIKVGLLARSVSFDSTSQTDGAQYGSLTDTKTYDILDIQDFDPPDDRVTRKVFSTTMLVRNE